MSFFAVYDVETRAVRRTGTVPRGMVRAQAIRANEAAVETDAEYKPGDLYVDESFVVRRVADNASVMAE